MPIDRSTDPGWQVVDESAFPELTRRAWRANGMRIGMVPVAEATDLREKLPRILGSRRTMLLASDRPAELIQAPRQPEPIRADLSMLPEADPATRTLRGGRLRLLSRVEGEAQGQLVLHLIPHHYKQRVSIKPRDPMEKELDGTVFRDLTLRMPVPRNQMLVIGLHREQQPEIDPTFPVNPPGQQEGDSSGGEETSEDPAASSQRDKLENAKNAEAVEKRLDEVKPSDSSDTDTNGNAADQPAQSKNAKEPEKSDRPERVEDALELPPHFGRALLTGRQFKRPRQIMLLIRVQRLR